MNVFVSVDIEGITGVVHGEMMMPFGREYDRGRRLMTADTNAAIDGLVQAGAEYILVNDGHGSMRNLLIEELHPAACLVTGSGDAKDLCQLEGVETDAFDLAVFVGYHAQARTPKAIHPHTIAGAVVGELRINGRPHGETGLNAAVLASLGIPTTMVTGDAATVAEAEAVLGPGIETVVVKTATGRNAAICRPLSATRPEITAAATRAGELRGTVKPYLPNAPWQLEIDFLTIQQCDRAGRIAGIRRVGPITAEVRGESPLEQYEVLWAAIRAALYEPTSWLS